MAPWLVWLGKLAAVLIAFLQFNPLPAHYRPARAPLRLIGQVARGVSVRVVKVVMRQECGGRRCRQVRYEWRERSDEPRRHYLYRAGVQLGGWDYDRCHWRDLHADGTWGPARDEAPVEVPGVDDPPATIGPEDVPFVAGEPPIPNHGLDLDKMPKAGRPRYAINGQDVDRRRAFEAIGASKAWIFPEDRDPLRITLIGRQLGGARLLQDLAADGPLGAWSAKVTVQGYESADVAMLKGLGFAADGLHVQAANGRPLWYSAAYEGPEQLDAGLQLADARRKDANWDPRKWPDLARPAIVPAPDSPALPQPLQISPLTLVTVAAVVIVALVLLSRRKAAS